MLIVQCAVIFGCLAAGEALVWATGVPVPGSIVGMLILTACLQTGLLKLRHVKGWASRISLCAGGGGAGGLFRCAQGAVGGYCWLGCGEHMGGACGHGPRSSADQKIYVKARRGWKR